MNVLFVANTHYQLLIVIRLAMTVYKDADKDIIISDHIKKNKEVYQNIKATQLFEQVIKSKDKYVWSNKNIAEKVISIFGVLKKRPTYVLKSIEKHYKLKKYDAVCFYNQTPFIINLLRYLEEEKPPESILFEESFLCYAGIHVPRSVKAMKLLYRISSGKKIMGKSTKMYFNEPEMASSNIGYHPEKLPDIESNEYLTVLNKIFNYENHREKYAETYILFESCYSAADGVDIGDENIFVSIAEKVGKENIIIKLHPRSKKNRFTRHNIKTVEAYQIPFELACYNEMMNNKYFITVNSSSVIETARIFGDKNRIIMLFKMLEWTPYLKETEQMIENLKRGSNVDIVVPETENELHRALDLK